jgi:hypothetical protein
MSLLLLLMVLVGFGGSILSKRFGNWLYPFGLIAAPGYLYLLRDGVDASCAINQSECIGAGGAAMIFEAIIVLAAVVGAVVLVMRKVKNRAVNH